MANKRVFDEVEALKINTIDVGGVASGGVDQGYIDEVESEDGGPGPAQYDEAGQQLTARFDATDVLQFIPLLISTPGTAQFHGHESGASTYTKATIGTTNSVLVLHSGDLTLSRGAYARMSVEGMIRSDGSEEFEDICVYLAGQAAPTLVYPGRLWKPTGLTHGSLAVLHPVDVTVRVAAILRGPAYGDGDKGVTAVDIAGHRVTVDLTVHDSGKYAATSYEVCTELIRQGVKDLTVNVEGVGQTADQVLTLRNCKFRSRRKTTGRDFTGHALSGVLQFHDPLTPFTVRTLNDGTPANRLINFA